MKYPIELDYIRLSDERFIHRQGNDGIELKLH